VSLPVIDMFYFCFHATLTYFKDFVAPATAPFLFLSFFLDVSYWIILSWVHRHLKYNDDAAPFVAPFEDDIQNITCILHILGKVTGLCTNF
jgi:hypothetical protein